MATHALTRRGFLGHVAGAYAAMALVSGLGAGVTLAQLMRRYVEAADAMGEASDLCDREPCEENEAAFVASADAYEAALLALLTFRPATLAEAGERFAYLYGRRGPWYGTVPDEWEIRHIAQSMMTETPA